MKKIFITILFAFLFTLVYMPIVSLASEISLSADKNNFIPDEEFLVQVFVDTEDTDVNAVGGEVDFSEKFLELKEIRDGNSAVNFWIEKPHQDTTGKIIFSGITTGGFSGSKMFLFGLVFKAKALGNSEIDFSKAEVLQNDGLGTKVSTKINSFSFSISKDGDGGQQSNLEMLKDKNPPENFTPFIGQDATLFEGKYFLAFSTVDKGVGIDHYEVREGILGKYTLAESPYLLKDQSLSKNIYVKALDKAQNERIVKLWARNIPLWLELSVIFAILLVLVIFLYKKYAKKHR